MRNSFVFRDLKAEVVVLVLVVVQRGRKVRATAGVSGRRAPVQPDRALRVQVIDLGTQSGERLRSVDLLDRRGVRLTRFLLPLRELGATAQHQEPAARKDGEERRTVGLLEEIVRLVVFRAVWTDAVEADLRRFAPAAGRHQLGAPVEHPRRAELGLDPLVILNGVAAAEVERVVGADVEGAASAESEAAARIRALEVRMPGQTAALQEFVELSEVLSRRLFGSYGRRVGTFAACSASIAACRVDAVEVCGGATLAAGACPPSPAVASGAGSGGGACAATVAVDAAASAATIRNLSNPEVRTYNPFEPALRPGWGGTDSPQKLI